MGEENIKKIKSDERTYRETMKGWQDKAREEGIPICTTCTRQDFNTKKLKDYADYTKGIKEIKRHEGSVREHGRKGEAEIKTLLIDYVCSRGHGLSVHSKVTKDYNFNKKTKEYKVDKKDSKVEE